MDLSSLTNTPGARKSAKRVGRGCGSGMGKTCCRGNKGQNAKLAAKLTGWKIDIRPESGFYGEDTED